MPGLGVADTARALAGLRAALAQTVEETARALIDEPRLEVKATLAAHLYEDAQTVRDLDARIEDLGGADGATPADADALLRRIDPLTDEATLRVVTGLVHRQRRHAGDLDPRAHPPRDRVDELDDHPSVEAAEQAARTLLQRDDADFRADLARIAADCMRHAIVAGHPGAGEHIAADQAVHARLRARWKL
jgi:hypothetical protein